MPSRAPNNDIVCVSFSGAGVVIQQQRSDFHHQTSLAGKYGHALSWREQNRSMSYMLRAVWRFFCKSSAHVRLTQFEQIATIEIWSLTRRIVSTGMKALGGHCFGHQIL